MCGDFTIVPGGLDIENFIKTPMIYSVSYFDLGGLSTLFGGISPPKPPRGDKTGSTSTSFNAFNNYYS